MKTEQGKAKRGGAGWRGAERGGARQPYLDYSKITALIRFYSSQIVLALLFLHSKGIIYR